MLSDRFRTAVERGHIAGAIELFREDAVFRSPVVYRPYTGRDAVLKVLEAAELVLARRPFPLRPSTRGQPSTCGDP
jgi:SnoaL-like domain